MKLCTDEMIGYFGKCIWFNWFNMKNMQIILRREEGKSKLEAIILFYGN